MTEPTETAQSRPPNPYHQPEPGQSLEFVLTPDEFEEAVQATWRAATHTLTVYAITHIQLHDAEGQTRLEDCVQSYLAISANDLIKEARYQARLPHHHRTNRIKVNAITAEHDPAVHWYIR